MKIVSNTLTSDFECADAKINMENKIKDYLYDYCGIDENLNGQSACHMMTKN